MVLPQDPGLGGSGRWGCFAIGAFIGIVMLTLLLMFGRLPFASDFFKGLSNPDFDTKGTSTSESATRSDGTVPQISERNYVGGNSPIMTTGAFALGSSLSLDFGRSDGERTTLRYGMSEETGQVIVALSSVPDEGYGLNVFQGTWVATSMGNDCMWNVQVTNNLVSGHVSCTGVPAENMQNGATGQVDIELDFSANS